MLPIADDKFQSLFATKRKREFYHSRRTGISQSCDKGHPLLHITRVGNGQGMLENAPVIATSTSDCHRSVCVRLRNGVNSRFRSSEPGARRGCGDRPVVPRSSFALWALNWPIETSIDTAIVHVQYARPPYRGRLRVKDDSGQFDRMGIASLAIHYDNDDEPTAVDFRPESIAFEPGRETEISIRVQRHESLTISASGRPFDEMASQFQ